MRNLKHTLILACAAVLVLLFGAPAVWAQTSTSMNFDGSDLMIVPTFIDLPVGNSERTIEF